jgi:hypothetical protein
MPIEIFAAVLGVLIAAAAIIIPRLLSHGNHPEDHSDAQAYLKETGRSAADIAQGNADQRLQQDSDAGSPRAGASEGPPPADGLPPGDASR